MQVADIDRFIMKKGSSLEDAVAPHADMWQRTASTGYTRGKIGES